MREDWVEIPEFPNYAVSDRGNVMNVNSELLKRPSVNQQGILMVNLMRDGDQHVRSVALLVAKLFLDDDQPEYFNSPIHLDGNKSNCRADNLAWRPRWFAVKYHQQFRPWERANRYGFLCPVELMDTGEVFATSWDAAIKYGLLDADIFIATLNEKPTPPIGLRFRVLDQ